MDKEEDSLGISVGIPLVRSAINNLSNLYTSYKDRKQRENHFDARLVFEHGLVKEQLKGREALSKSERRVAAYSLPDYGHLADLLPDDGLPAVLVSEIYNGSSKPAKPSIKPLITGVLSEIEENNKLLHECSGALKKSSGYPGLITGKFQALEICVNEFFNRPAIVIYHESDTLSIHSYALLWNLSPWKFGIAWDQLKIVDIEINDDEPATEEGLQGPISHRLRPEKRSPASRRYVEIRRFLADACLSATCAIVDAHQALQGRPTPLFQKFVEPMEATDRQCEIYIKFITYMTQLAAGQCNPNIYMLSPFMLWLEDELRLLHNAGYQFGAEEQPGGSVALLVDIGSSRKVAFWLSRSYETTPPNIFLHNPYGESVSFDIGLETWSAGPNLLNIVIAIAASQ